MRCGAFPRTPARGVRSVLDRATYLLEHMARVGGNVRARAGRYRLARRFLVPCGTSHSVS